MKTLFRIAIYGSLLMFASQHARWLLIAHQSETTRTTPPVTLAPDQIRVGNNIVSKQGYDAENAGIAYVREKKAADFQDCNNMPYPHPAYRPTAVYQCKLALYRSLPPPPPIPEQGDWSGGKTTAECLAEIENHFRAASEAHMKAFGEPKGIDWEWRSLKEMECGNYDRLRNPVIVGSRRLLRIRYAMEETGSSLSSSDRQAILADIDEVSHSPWGTSDSAKQYLIDARLFIENH